MSKTVIFYYGCNGCSGNKNNYWIPKNRGEAISIDND